MSGQAAIAPKTSITRDMAAMATHANALDQVLETSAQEKGKASSGAQNDMQTSGTGEVAKPDEVEHRMEHTRKEGQDAVEKEKLQNNPQPSKLKVFWDKVGLDTGTIIVMFKGSLPPLIGIAFYQSPAVAATYGQLGYLVPIISVISMAIMPRAKFLQNLVFNVIGICLGSAIALLGLWSSIQARINTTPAGSTAPYNSSQAAVCAIWLTFNIWLINMLRAKYPALQFPSIMYSIFVNVAFTFGPVFPTMGLAQALIKQLLIGFLTAFALATGVCLFVIPISSRTVVFGEMTGYIGAIRGTIKAQTLYLESLEKSDMFSHKQTEEATDQDVRKGKRSKDDKPTPANHPEGLALKASIAGLTSLHGKLHGDLPFGKREFAYGKLGPDDLEEIFKLFQGILIPLIGMSTITDIFERVAERRGWVHSAERPSFDDVEEWERDPGETAKRQEKALWNDIMKQLHCSFDVVSKTIDEGLEHAGLLLEFIKSPKAKSDPVPDVDIEAKGDSVKPGDKGFSECLEKKLSDFYANRGETLRTWAKGRGLSAEHFDAAKSPGIDESDPSPDENRHRRDQQQLYLILYMEFLLYSAGSAILKFIRFAEEKVEDGTMKKNRLITPGQHRIRKWILSLGTEDATVDSNTPDSIEGASSKVYLGSGFSKRKDPEHLPAANAWEKFGNGIRKIPHFLGSVESGFGARAALATMTIGIVAFLEDTQDFFFQQRLVWAMIIVAIGMTVTAGQAVFGFFLRTAGTALAMVFSIVIWYIPDEHPPGVIIILWLFIFCEYYFLIKFPRFIPAFLITIVTEVLIIGYELQVGVVGATGAGALSQPYYPIYLLAPYRLACVAGGCLVAFIWTIFPFPLTDGSWLRKDLGTTIFILAEYYSVVSTTVRARVGRTEGDIEDKSSPGRKLEKVRRKTLGKLLILLPSLRQHAAWQKWEPGLGGKFPVERYNSIIQRLTNIMNYLSLIAYATQTWTTPTSPDSDTSTLSHHAWLEDLSVLLKEVTPTSHSFTSSLALLSASITQGSPLPPYMELPQPYGLSRKLEKLDRGILAVKHVQEPGYSAYAVMQVATSLVVDDLKWLIEDVKSLVGEVDFSFTVVRSEGSSETNVATGDDGKGKQD